MPEVPSTLCILITNTYFPHYRTALKYIERKDDELRHARQEREAAGKEEPEEKGSTSILESFFETGLEDKDIVALVVDTFHAGVETVQYINLTLCPFKLIWKNTSKFPSSEFQLMFV